MSWWDDLKGWFGPRPEPGDGGESKDAGKARWLPAEAASFGVPVLDLYSVIGSMISVSADPRAAELSVSWSKKEVHELEAPKESVASFPCELRLPAEEDLPEGWLYVPSRMEEKWAIGYREGRILLARSWSGAIEAVAEVRHEANQIVVDRLTLMGALLDQFGDPRETFEWILRSHALAQLVPLPVHEEAATILEEVPLSVFSIHGVKAVCAARSWSPPPPARPLRSTSAIVTATRLGNTARLSELAAAGHSLDARSAMGGYTALHIAVIHRNPETTARLLQLGADPNITAERGMTAFLVALVQRNSIEMLDLLTAHGADALRTNTDGFGALHALAEVDHAEPVAWLLSRGLDLERKTGNGHTALQIAAALEHVETLDALLRAGANPEERAADGKTAREIALAEGKARSVEALDRWASRRK